MGNVTAKPETMVCRDRAFRWGERTYVMGIINLTPDSFSGDGVAARPKAALKLALDLEALGADIIDIGAESTRPRHTPVSDDEELSRLIPSLEAIASDVRVPISVDTYKSGVAEAALEAGASMINDIWGLKADPQIAQLAARYRVPVALVHNQATAEYRDPVPDVIAGLWSSAETALQAGVPPENIIVDPGIGFGKTADQNLEILRRLPEFKALGFPLLVGASRKSTIGLVLDLPVEQRVEGTAATVALAIAGGADIVRVHDVGEMVRVARMSDAIVRDWRPQGWKG